MELYLFFGGVKMCDSEVKMLKFVEDPCFGQKHKQCEGCEKCWIKQACLVAFRNKK